MVIGKLVKNTANRVGTVIKATRYELAHNDWKPSDRDRHEITAAIRPGYVVSVRWQEDMNVKTSHVFYDGIEDSAMDFGPSSQISLVAQ